MFIYPDNGENEAANEDEKAEVMRRYLAFRRLFGRRPHFVRGGFSGPMLQLMLNHFYETEIEGPYKFSEIELTDSVMKNFFENIAFNHIQ